MWNIPKKCTSHINKQWKSDLDISWECFMFDNSELNCWKFYNGSQMGVYDFSMPEIGGLFWNTYWFVNRSQFDPLHCTADSIGNKLLSIFDLAEYTKIGGDEELPLGEEFQEHLRRFLKPSEKKVTKRIELVRKIVDQLAWVTRFNSDRLCTFLRLAIHVHMECWSRHL